MKIRNLSKDGLNDQDTCVTNQSTSLWDSQYKCRPARDRNYSNSVSADTVRGVAGETLQAVLTGLERIVDSEEGAGRGVPAAIGLRQNCPIPSFTSTLIACQVPASGDVTLRVYDPPWKGLSATASGREPAACRTGRFDGSGFPSGVCRLKAGGDDNASAGEIRRTTRPPHAEKR